MTHVVVIPELKKLIPEISKLEGMDFNNDLKKFLKTIIPLIENSGNCEFVQYLSQSGIFNVREKEYEYHNLEPELEKAKGTRSTSVKKEENKNPDPVSSEEKLIKNEEKMVVENSNLFSTIKLPWK